MANMLDDEDSFFFESSLPQTSSAFAGQAFDDLFPGTPANGFATASPAYLNPTALALRNPTRSQVGPRPSSTRDTSSGSPSRSPDTSIEGSSSGSSSHHNRNLSKNSTKSTAYNAGVTPSDGGWGSGVQGYSMPAGDGFFPDTDMTGIEADFETSNEQMASAFDFDTAASTPSGFVTTTGISNIKTEHLRDSPKYVNPLMAMKKTSPVSTVFTCLNDIRSTSLAYDRWNWSVLLRISRALTVECYAPNTRPVSMEQELTILGARGDLQWHYNERRLPSKPYLLPQPSIPNQRLLIRWSRFQCDAVYTRQAGFLLAPLNYQLRL